MEKVKISGDEDRVGALSLVVIMLVEVVMVVVMMVEVSTN